MRCCPKCKYVRKTADMAPAWQCPACHGAYVKMSEPCKVESIDYEIGKPKSNYGLRITQLIVIIMSVGIMIKEHNENEIGQIIMGILIMFFAMMLVKHRDYESKWWFQPGLYYFLNRPRDHKSDINISMRLLGGLLFIAGLGLAMQAVF